LGVGSCDETCPEDGHDIPGSGLAVSYEFGAEPEPSCDKLGGTGVIHYYTLLTEHLESLDIAGATGANNPLKS